MTFRRSDKAIAMAFIAVFASTNIATAFPTYHPNMSDNLPIAHSYHSGDAGAQHHREHHKPHHDRGGHNYAHDGHQGQHHYGHHRKLHGSRHGEMMSGHPVVRSGPTLAIKTGGEGFSIEFECSASMEECLDAIERVYEISGQRRQTTDAEVEQEN